MVAVAAALVAQADRLSKGINHEHIGSSDFRARRRWRPWRRRPRPKWAAPSGCLACADGQTYRIVYQTVFEQQQVTAYRIDYETVIEERPVTTYKPVWETAVRENRYTVARPVVETAEREETYTVQRPVYETAEREEAYTVMKPVYETAYRTEYHTVYQPVTTYRTQYVDQGCYAEQMVLKPCWPVTRLAWQSGGCTVDPVTGQTVYQRAGLYWVQTPRGEYEVQRVWHPNVVAQQIPQTCMVPQTVAQQVPMQVCKYVPETVVRKVPVQVCRMVDRAAGAAGAGDDLQDGLRRAGRAGAVPGVPDGGRAGDDPGAALRREADAGGVHVQRAAGGVLPRAAGRLRQSDRRPGVGRRCRAGGAGAAAAADARPEALRRRVKPSLGPDAAAPKPVPTGGEAAAEGGGADEGRPAGGSAAAVGHLPVEEGRVTAEIGTRRAAPRAAGPESAALRRPHRVSVAFASGIFVRVYDRQRF